MSIARRRSWIVVALACAGALVAVEAFTSGARTRAAGTPSPSSSAAQPKRAGWVASAPKIAPGAPRRVEHGAQLTYEASFGIRLEGSADAADGGLRLWGTSRLTLTVSDAGPEGYALVGQISEPTLTSERPGTSSDELRSAVFGSLAHPFRLGVGARGRLVSLETSADVGGLSLGLLKSLVGGLQFVTSEDGKADEWTAEESDAHGTYRAGYRRVELDRYSKRKLDYSRFSSSYPNDSIPKLVYSANVEHDGNFLRSSRSQERMEVPFGKESLVSETELTLTLVALGRGEAPALASGLRRASLDAPIDAMASIEVQAREQRRKSVAGKSFESLSDELARAKDAEGRVEVMSLLAALVELDPVALRKTLLALKDPGKAAQRDVLLGALCSAESAEVKNAVSDLAADPAVEPGLRKQAATQLGLIEQPTPEIVEGLERLSDDADTTLAKTALLSLGGAARRAGAAADEGAGRSAQAAIGRLVLEAEGAQSDEQRMLYLDALGNSGSPQALAFVEKALRDPNEAVRARAVAALRFIPGPRVDALLLEASRDASDTLRAMAVGSIADRPMNEQLVAGLFLALQREEEQTVRREVVRALSAALPREDAIAALLWAADNEKNEELRQTVNQALATAGKG